MSLSEAAHADVVILGGGVAGLSALLRAAGRDILVIHPASEFGSSELALGGVAAALQGDEAEHVADTCRAGAGHCDGRRVELLVSDGRRRVEELVGAGMPFDRDGRGELAFGLEAGHTRSRVLHADGDATGRALVKFLASKARVQRRVRRIAGAATELMVDDAGRVAGVVFRGANGHLASVRAAEVVLATGGISSLFCHTSNAGAALGDGIALALAAGAGVVDMEFVQFHPTAMNVRSRPMPLVTEALRGAGALLVDEEGARVMEGIHPALELAPRDVVARAVWALRSAGRAVYLDARGVPDLEAQFPALTEICTRLGVDVRHIPVAPAAHFHMGGVEVDDDGRTAVEGLWACGECAGTGVHGANRLASNSLLEALVFGHRVGDALAGAEVGVRGRPRAGERMERNEGFAPAEPVESEALADVFWRAFGVERSGASLRAAVEWIDSAAAFVEPASAVGSRLQLAKLLGRAALHRRESRGAHYRLDYPDADPGWSCRTRQRLVDGELRLEEVSVQSQA